MSALEETVIDSGVKVNTQPRAGDSYAARVIKMLCSVRFGIVMLILLGLSCLVGMLVMQENVSGFSNYYATLTPAQQVIYGKLDFFDIYHSWYFNAILAVLSLNIVLASVDRFPKTHAAVSKPPLTPPVRWLKDQRQNAELQIEGSEENVIEKVKNAYAKSGIKKIEIAEKGGKTFVFGESGRWNRYGYLAVHVGLLTIFTGGFLTTQLGQNGQMPLAPGETSNEMLESVFELDQVKEIRKRLPFEIVCTDIQQKLIKDDGSISAGNTIDWLTRIQIKDGGETHDAVVQMNRPFDYRGYRFFQSSFTAIGRARNITVRLVPENGSGPTDITLARGGTETLPDGTKIKFDEFRGKFSIGPENLNEDTSNYPSPGAILKVTAPGGMAQNAYAFGEKMANLPVAKKPVAGYTYQLINFEKVADRHILAVQYDPGATVVYVGFFVLCLTLVAVFFFSHKRVWTVIQRSGDEKFHAVIGGNSNRNQNGFDDKFNRLVMMLK